MMIDRLKRVLVSKGKYVAEKIASGGFRTTVLQAIPFWVASLITGCIAVVYARVFGMAEHMLVAAMHWRPWSIFLLAPTCFLLSWLMVKTLAPYARGSGIPQVMAALDMPSRSKEAISSLLSMKILVVKIISSFFMVLGGGVVGREGPTIQIAASVFRVVSKWVPASWPKLSDKSFLLTGAAAGLAAAFNTPLGGIVFAIEELARIHVNFFKTALFTAVILAGLTAQALLGPYLYLGYPDVKGLDSIIFLGVGFCAVVSGMLGSLLCVVVLRIMRWKRSFNNFQNVLFILASAFIIACFAYWINAELLGSGKELMNRTLFTSEKRVEWYMVLLRIVGPILSFNVGGAGGVFAPALTAGASVGAFVSDVFNIAGANANILILSGMVGFLTGVTRTPFTSAILVLEMTDRHSVIFHLMLAGMVASIAAIIVDKHSFYEQLKKDFLPAKDAES